MPAQRPKPGPLFLVVDSDLPSVEKANFSYRGGLFVTARQIQKPDDVPRSIERVWLDGSLDDDDLKRLVKVVEDFKLVVRRRIVVFKNSSELIRLRRILDDKLPPLTSGKSGDDAPERQADLDRIRRLEELQNNDLLVRIRQLEAEVNRLRDDLKVAYDAQKVSSDTNLRATKDRLESDLTRSEVARRHLEVALAEASSARGRAEQELSTATDRLREYDQIQAQLIDQLAEAKRLNNTEDLQQRLDEVLQLNAHLVEQAETSAAQDYKEFYLFRLQFRNFAKLVRRLERARPKPDIAEVAKSAMTVLVNYKTVIGQFKLASLSSQEVGWLKKIERQLEEFANSLGNPKEYS